LRAASSGSTCVNHQAVAQRAFGSGSDGFLPAHECAGGRTHSQWSEVRFFIMPAGSSVFANDAFRPILSINSPICDVEEVLKCKTPCPNQRSRAGELQPSKLRGTSWIEMTGRKQTHCQQARLPFADSIQWPSMTSAIAAIINTAPANRHRRMFAPRCCSRLANQCPMPHTATTLHKPREL